MNLSPGLQRDLVEALRDVLPQLCPWCVAEHPVQLEPPGVWVHTWNRDVSVHRAWCLASEQRALLTRVDAEIAAQANGASDAE